MNDTFIRNQELIMRSSAKSCALRIKLKNHPDSQNSLCSIMPGILAKAEHGYLPDNKEIKSC